MRTENGKTQRLPTNERRYEDVVADRADSYLCSCYDGGDYCDVGGCEMDERKESG